MYESHRCEKLMTLQVSIKKTILSKYGEFLAMKLLSFFSIQFESDQLVTELEIVIKLDRVDERPVANASFFSSAASVQRLDESRLELKSSLRYSLSFCVMQREQTAE
jgi:hypothetical protein